MNLELEKVGVKLFVLTPSFSKLKGPTERRSSERFWVCHYQSVRGLLWYSKYFSVLKSCVLFQILWTDVSDVQAAKRDYSLHSLV